LEKYFYRGRQLASDVDYTTQLLVSLDDQGRVIRVQIIGASGTRDLDEAAVKAFNEAGPFPNPPTGLVKNGQVHVRWDFVLRTYGEESGQDFQAFHAFGDEVFRPERVHATEGANAFARRFNFGRTLFAREQSDRLKDRAERRFVHQ